MIRAFFKNKWVRGVLIIHAVGLLVLIVTFFYVRNITENEFEEAIVKTPYDAIIVPGVPFKNGQWSEIMKMRVHWSKYLFDQGYAKNIIYSGSAVYSPHVEGKIMKLYGIALGLPADSLFVDTAAEHSTENVHYSMLLAKKNGFKNIALATDPFQSFFLMRFVSNRNLNVALLPIQFDILEDLNLTNPEIDPSSAFVENFVSLPDRQGFFERFNGTLGNNIDNTVD